jgi:hypothetical protein
MLASLREYDGSRCLTADEFQWMDDNEKLADSSGLDDLVAIHLSTCAKCNPKD